MKYTNNNRRAQIITKCQFDIESGNKANDIPTVD